MRARYFNIEVNGNPVKTSECETETLNEEQKNILNEWINERIKPFVLESGWIPKRNPTSYTFKHIAEKSLGFYVSNLDFKVAMAMSDIKSDGDFNCRYAISSTISKVKVDRALREPFKR